MGFHLNVSYYFYTISILFRWKFDIVLTVWIPIQWVHQIQFKTLDFEINRWVIRWAWNWDGFRVFLSILGIFWVFQIILSYFKFNMIIQYNSIQINSNSIYFNELSIHIWYLFDTILNLKIDVFNLKIDDQCMLDSILFDIISIPFWYYSSVQFDSISCILNSIIVFLIFVFDTFLV